MIKYLPLLGMLLFSCSTQIVEGEYIPVFGGDSKQICNADCPESEQTAVSISLMDSILMDWNLPHTQDFEHLTIEWNEYEGGEYYGLTLEHTNIYLWDITPGDVQKSALCHELIHTALWWNYEDPDVDHNNILFNHNDGLPSAERECQNEVYQYGL